MRHKLEEAARRKMLAEETRFQRWRRVLKEELLVRWNWLKGKIIRSIQTVWNILRGVGRATLKCWRGFWRFVDDNFGGLFVTAACIITIGVVGWILYKDANKEYLVISEDRCWKSDSSVTRSSSGALYFDTDEGRIYLSEWEKIELRNDDHTYENLAVVLGRDDLDLDNCYQDED